MPTKRIRSEFDNINVTNKATMRTPIIHFQDYLNVRKNDYANARFGVLYNELSHMGKDAIDDLVAEEYIKIFMMLYKDAK